MKCTRCGLPIALDTPSTFVSYYGTVVLCQLCRAMVEPIQWEKYWMDVERATRT